MLRNESFRFMLKVTVAHIVTYIICGVLFSTVLNYATVWQTGMFKEGISTMRDYNSL